MQTATLRSSHLSLQQARLWSMQGENAAFHVQGAVMIEGSLRVDLLRLSIHEVLQQHEILRTVFYHVPGMDIPVQVVTANGQLACPVFDLKDMDYASKDERVDELWAQFSHKPFDLAKGPLFSCCLLQLAPAQHLLLLRFSAFSADNPTLRIFVDQLCQTYTALMHHRKLANEPLQYADVSAWQNDLLQEEEAELHKEAWRKYSPEHSTDLHLPYEGSATSTKFDPVVLPVPLSAAIVDQIRDLALKHRVAPEALILACWQILTARLAATTSLVVGVACNGRSYEELTDASGLYTRYVPIGANFENDSSFSRTLTNANKSLEEARKQQMYFVPEPEEKPFVVSFTAEQWPERFEAAGMQLRMQRRSGWQEPFVVQLSVLEIGEHLWLELHYDRSRLDPQQVQGWLAGLQRLVEQALATPEMLVSQLPVVSQQEEQWQQEQGEGERLEGTMPSCFHELFEQQVRQWPAAPALCDEQERWSYAQLNAQANQLARALREQEVEAGELVGVCLPRGAGMIVSVLGVLKAGGAYVPLEPEQPAERLALVLTQTQMRVLLTERGVARTLPVPQGWAGRLVCLEEVAWSQYEEENLALSGDGEQVASVIYTSGSTGMPKGVMLQQRNLLAYTQGLLHRVQGQAGWRYATVSTLGADLGNSAIFGALGSGGCLYVVSYATLTQAQRFAELMQRERIDVLKIVPSHLSSLLAGVPMEQRGALLPRERLIVGGERFSVGLREQLREIAPSCEAYNHYGPTETTVGVLMSRVDLWAQEGEVPLGRPLARSWVAVLDRWGERVPAGVVGELYVGGAGVSAGYLGAQEQTQARFVPVKWRAGERMYRTGDLVRMRQDGQLVFVGRVDRQVKLRGYRIELGEIEAQLSHHPQVREAAVLLREDQEHEPQVVGYLIARERPEPTEEEIKQYLRERVPEYMVPASLIWLHVFPLTSNGKIDYQQLPAPSVEREALSGQNGPRNPIEEIMRTIWQEVLKTPVPSVHENFFNLGGHSLLATQVVSRVRMIFGIELPIVSLFEAPTIAGVARQIEMTLQGTHKGEILPLQRVSREQELPLSFAQQRLWFLDQLEPANSAYSKSIAIKLRGALSISALESSLRTIVQRHEVLRTTFSVSNGLPKQHIQMEANFKLKLIDLSVLEFVDQTSLALKLAEVEGRQPINLTRDLPIRVALVRLNENEHHLLLTLHHIVSDAWSNGIFMRELNTLYADFVNGVEPSLSTLPLQYVDFAFWQRAWLQGEVLEEELLYWKRQLQGVVPLELPTDRPRSLIPTFLGETYGLQLPKALSDDLRRLSQGEGTTLFMTLLAAFQILLSRYTLQTDIAVGTPIANRDRAEIENLIGFFVNTLVMRSDLAGNPTFRELLKQVRTVALGAYAHQDLPFEKLVEMLQPERDLSRSPLFQVMFSLHNVPMSSSELPGLQIDVRENESGATKFDLTVGVIENEQGLYCIVEYLTDLFDRATIVHLLDHWQNLLHSIVAHPEQRLNDLPLLSPAERHQVLVEWNTTDANYPRGCVHQLFEQIVQSTPDSIALVLEDECLTYGALNQYANQLGHFLQQWGVEPDVLVGICMSRSLEMMITLLGVLKAGGAYLPLDMNYPEERLAFMLEDAQCSIVLTRGDLSLPVTQLPLIQVELGQAWPQIAQESPLAPVSSVQAQHLAYVIYTSGSTGQPKGVQVAHQGLGNLGTTAARTFGVRPGSRVLQFASFSFDASVFEILMGWFGGASVHLVPPAVNPGAELAHLLREQGITTMVLTPSSLQILPAVDLPELETVMTAGEPCTEELVTRWEPQRSFFNLYGPTEASVWASVTQCFANETVTIGRPIANVRLFLLDRSLQPVPQGVPGEIYIDSVGLARGYLDRPDLTAERFAPHPFSQEEGAILYKTGDIARYLSNGDLQFIGRIDQQVKVRGYRIELGEIEAALTMHPSLREGVVQMQEDTMGSKRLVAYVVFKDAARGTSATQLRKDMQKWLPAYMVPTSFVVLEHLPLTTSGKVDRRALPKPDVNKLADRDSVIDPLSDSYASAHSPIEEVIAAIWGAILGLDQVDINENFFELGGHSLLATQIIARVQEVMGVEMAVSSLFEAPTVTKLAAQVEHILQDKHALKIPPLEPLSRQQALYLSFAQQRLWFLQQLEPDNCVYNLPMALYLHGDLDKEVLERCLAEIIGRHESLRTTFKIVDGQVVQIIKPASTFHLQQKDLGQFPSTERDGIARRLVEEDGERPLDLSEDPPLRAVLLRLDERKHVLGLTMHHIISDGWSNSIFLRELMTLYPAFKAGDPSPLPELRFQYADFAAWQRKWLQGDVLERQLEYWSVQLRDATPLALPTDRVRPRIQSHVGAREVFLLPDTLSEDIKSFSRRMGTTLFMTLLGAFQVLLHRYTDQDDILVGTPIANRHLAETESIIGFFVNTLVMRANLAGNPTFEVVLKQVRETALAAYTHQDAPFEKLVEALQPERDLSRTPLFQVMFSLQNRETLIKDLGDLKVEALESINKQAKFDLTLSIVETEQGLRCEMGYNIDLFLRETIARMFQHWQRLLEGIIHNPAQRISEISLLTQGESSNAFIESSDTIVSQPGVQCFHELFEQQVCQWPDAPALCDEQERWSYAQLNAQANRLARALREQGVEAGELVGVCLPRGAAMIVSMLGVLKAGGAYVPLEPEQPAERLALVLTQTQMRVLLTERGVARTLPVPQGWAGRLVCLEEVAWSQYEEENLALSGDGEQVASVIYTSGSTGMPKGVMLQQRNLLSYTQGLLHRVQGQAGWRYATVSTLGADLGNSAIFGALGSGGCLYVVSYATLTQAQRFAELMQRERIDVLKIVPSHLSSLLAGVPVEQRGALLPRERLILGGERFSVGLREQLREIAPSCEVYNHYGPTETTVGVLMSRVDLWAQEGEVPLGRPLARSWVAVLDRWGERVPAGVVGELYIGGVGVSAGYLGAQEQTQARFVPVKWRAGERVYRTGDRVRMRQDGQLVFVGRVDRQVKLRGYRIELGEIEAQLSRHPQVREAVVLLREDEPGQERLVAYVVLHQGFLDLETDLTEYLSTRTPEYMVPSAWVELERLPLTSNGKIDYRQLPASIIKEIRGTQGGQPFTPVEELIQTIWQDLLKVPSPGLHESFFRLGGHSLLATQVISRLRTVFGVELPIMSLFETPTIAGLARKVEAAFHGERHQAIPPLRRVSREQPLLLSFAQQRLWFLEQLTPGTTAYTLPLAVWLTGPLSLSAFARSLQEMVRRHEILRTTFPSQDGQPVQRIGAVGGFGLLRADLRGLPQAEAEEEAERLARQQSERVFDLERGPLVRGSYIQVGPERGLFVFTMHHIVSDGWSNTVFMNEVSQLYRAFVAGQPSPLPALDLHYVDYAAWQRSWLQGAVMEQERRYWQARLGDLAPLDLPTDWPRPAVLGSQGARISLSLPASLSEQLRRLSQQEEVTLFMTLLTGFQVLLGRLSQQEDVAVGTPIANRNRVEIEPLIGFFVNTLVLRTDLSGQPGVREVLRRVRRGTLEAYEHQDVPFEQIVEAVQPERDLSRSPLFQVMFVLQNAPRGEETPFAGLKMQPVSWEQQSKVDLALVVADGREQLRCSLQYNRDLFARESMQRLLEQWERVLEAMVADVEQPITRISLLSAAQREHLLYAWNRSQKPLEASVCLHELIEQQVQRQPEAVALVYEEDQLTYGSLEQRANQLGWFLQEQGVGPEVRVGLCMERSVEMVIALLAILKVGGAYVPLDPHYPQERLAYLLHDAGCKLVLTHGPQAQQVLPATVPQIPLARCWQLAPPQSLTGTGQVKAENLAYVIYTSGSTGAPKGVAVTHRGIGHLAQEQSQLFGMSRQSRELQFASLSFDASLSEIAVALVSGATLCLAPQERLLPGGALEHLVEEQAITLLTLPPSVLEQVSEQQMLGVETLVVAGEVSRSGLLERWVQGRRMVNAYGPTEATVCACGGQYQQGQPVTIGDRLAHTWLYVLDEQMEPVPLGVEGELYIGGAGVARGYHGRADLTAERFVPDPFGEQEGSRLYKTGDQVRRRGDGRLEFVGRRDGQVKLRGYRIEVGEIENVISQHPGVQSCVVMLREDRVGDQRLVAYLVSKPGAVIVEEQLRQQMRRLLPEYMQPNHLVQLEALPLSMTGKLDLKALPPPKMREYTDTGWLDSNGLETPIEELVMHAWKEVLGVEQVEQEDNFFVQGGHSLLATQLLAKIRDMTGVDILLRHLFETPTIAGLAKSVREALFNQGNEGSDHIPPLLPVSREQELPLSFAQQRLWFLEQLEPGKTIYTIPVALRVKGALHVQSLEHSITEIVRRHESLRTTFRNVGGYPTQIIGTSEDFRLHYIDLQPLDPEAQEAEMQRLAILEARQPFNLSQGLLMRVTLIRIKKNEYVLLQTLHHIITDGWSNSLFLREFTTLYKAFCEGNVSPLSELPVQYADFAVWQRKWLQGEVLEKHLNYWKKQLQHIAPLRLATDRPRPEVQTYAGNYQDLQLSQDLSEHLKSLSQREGLTLFMTLLGAFQTLLFRYTGQEYISVGTDIANRNQRETQGIIGFFVNTLVMCTDVSGNPTFRELLRRVREVALGAYAHQDLPFEKLVEALQPKRDSSRSPLFQVRFRMQNVPKPADQLPGLTFSPLEEEHTTAKFDLSMQVIEADQQLHCRVEYSTDLFMDMTITHLLEDWQSLLIAIVANPDLPIAQISPGLEAESDQLLLSFNDQLE